MAIRMGRRFLARGIQYAGRRSRRYGQHWSRFFGAAGASLMAGGDSDFDFLAVVNGMTMAGGARLLCHEPRRGLFFKAVGQAASETQNACSGFDCAGWLGCAAVRLGFLWATAGLHRLRGAALLHPHHCWSLCPAGKVSPASLDLTRRLATRFLPALYIAMAAWICVVLLRYKPQ